MRFLVFATLVLGFAVHAEEAPKYCQVKLGKKVVGNFEAQVTEQEMTAKTFKLPGGKFATARVYYTDDLAQIEWGEDGVLDVTTTIRLDVADAPVKTKFNLLDPKNATRVVLSEKAWEDAPKASSICTRVLADEGYARQISNGNFDLILDSCEAYIGNKKQNVIRVAQPLWDKTLSLECRDREPGITPLFPIL